MRLSGYINVDNEKVRAWIIPNRAKQNPKHPDYQLRVFLKGFWVTAGLFWEVEEQEHGSSK